MMAGGLFNNNHGDREDFLDLATRDMQPEQILWLRVIQRAVNDALSRATACAGRRGKTDRFVYERKAKSYIIHQTGSFEYACDAIGISRETIRSLLIRRLKIIEEQKITEAALAGRAASGVGRKSGSNIGTGKPCRTNPASNTKGCQAKSTRPEKRGLPRS